MKCVLENIQGERANVDVNISDTPVAIMNNLYAQDAMTASIFFENDMAIEQLKMGQVDEAKCVFSLTSHEGDFIKCDWKTPLCEQPPVKEDLAVLEGFGDIPVFEVSVSSIVA